MLHKTKTKQQKTKKRLVRKRPVRGKENKEFYGYDFVLLTDISTGRSRQLGGPVRKPATIFEKDPVHRAAWETALKQGIYHYEWADTRGKKRTIYQTTCVALQHAEGQTRGVVSFSRDITNTGYSEGIAYGLHESAAAPRTFAQLLLASREAEKRDISKALHDEIGSSAVMLSSMLMLLRTSVKSNDNEQALRDLEQLDQQVKSMIGRLRKVIVSLRPPSLENKGGLGGALRDLLENISTFNRLTYTFDYDKVDDHFGVSDNVKILLYRIVQEALTNTVKHARAKQVRVSLKHKEDDILLEVSDDGAGFNPDEQRSIEHIGLLAMRDSVELLGGTITINSAPGKGTRITVVCPCIVYGGN